MQRVRVHVHSRPALFYFGTKCNIIAACGCLSTLSVGNICGPKVFDIQCAVCKTVVRVARVTEKYMALIVCSSK